MGRTTVPVGVCVSVSIGLIDETDTHTHKHTHTLALLQCGQCWRQIRSEVLLPDSVHFTADQYIRLPLLSKVLCRGTFFVKQIHTEIS